MLTIAHATCMYRLIGTNRKHFRCTENNIHLLNKCISAIESNLVESSDDSKTPTRKRLGRIRIRTLSMQTPPQASPVKAAPVKRAPATLTAATANATESENETNEASKSDVMFKEERGYMKAIRSTRRSLANLIDHQWQANRSTSKNANSKNLNVVKACIAAGFYPNVFNNDKLSSSGVKMF